MNITVPKSVPSHRTSPVSDSGFNDKLNVIASALNQDVIESKDGIGSMSVFHLVFGLFILIHPSLRMNNSSVHFWT